jgi:hypothetical protein
MAKKCDLDDPICFIASKPKKIDDVSSMDIDTLRKHIFNGQLTKEDRVESMKEYTVRDPRGCLEILQQLLQMFMFSSSSILEELVHYLCTQPGDIIDIYKKIDCFKTLYSRSDNMDILIHLGEYIYNSLLNCHDPMDLYHIDMLIHLYSLYEYSGVLTESKDDGNCVLNLLSSYFNNGSIDCEMRYRNLISLDKKVVIVPNLHIKDTMFSQYSYSYNVPHNMMDETFTDYPTDKLFPRFMVIGMYHSFVENDDNDINFRILCCQYILQTQNTIDRVFYQEKLKDWGGCPHLDYNTRADASDVLLSLGDEVYKDMAENIILELGNNGKVSHNVYNFKQNVHSVGGMVYQEFTKLLSIFSNMQVDQQPFDSVKTEVLALARKTYTNDKNYKKVMVAVQRIRNDNYIIMDKYSLCDVLCIVWTVVNRTPHRKTLCSCLLDELYEMSNTCSNGHFSRLVNSLSGFTLVDPKTGKNVIFSVKIEWVDQIYAYFQKNIMKRIQEIEDEDYQSSILLEMIWDVPIDEKPNFNKFYIANISAIEMELKAEFINDVPPDEISGYIDTCVIKFVSGGDLTL